MSKYIKIQWPEDSLYQTICTPKAWRIHPGAPQWYYDGQFIWLGERKHVVKPQTKKLPDQRLEDEVMTTIAFALSPYTFDFKQEPRDKFLDDVTPKIAHLVRSYVESELEKIQFICENEDSEFAFNLANAIEDKIYYMKYRTDQV